MLTWPGRRHQFAAINFYLRATVLTAYYLASANAMKFLLKTILFIHVLISSSQIPLMEKNADTWILETDRVRRIKLRSKQIQVRRDKERGDGLSKEKIRKKEEAERERK
jgi:hypothetical protein